MSAYLVPCLLAFIPLYALLRGTDAFTVFRDGAKQGLAATIRLLPTLVGLLIAVTMLRASGLLDLLAALMSPVLRFVGLPGELAPLIFMKPFSGSGAVAVGTELMAAYGVDSTTGKLAAVLLASGETTFYVAAIYLAGVKNTRWAIPSALAGELAVILAAGLAARLFF